MPNEQTREEQRMQADHALDESRLQLPEDLLSELRRRDAAPRTDMRVEGWTPSLLARLIGLLTGRREPRH